MPEGSLAADGLVRHPRPYPTESLFGYILRLAEENGYPTPYGVLALIGFGKSRFECRRLPLRELARVAHRELHELERIAYYCSDPRRYLVLGYPVAPHDLKRVNHPSLCPDCIRSAGFIEAHWDLDLMTGCPVHRTRLLSCCPKCHLRLRWLRPGQLGCTCGAMLARVDGPTLPDDEAELLDIIRRKVLGVPVSQQSSVGMPISGLSALSLRGLLSLMRVLAKFDFQLKSVHQQLDDPERVVKAAAHVLRSFPENFHKLLWTIGEQYVPKRCGEGVRTQFDHIYTSIFKFRGGDPPQSRDFLGSAFLDFAINQWGRGIVDAKMLHRLQSGIPKRFISPAEFRKRYGLGKRPGARVLAIKNIPTIKIRMGKRIYTRIDLQQLPESPTTPGRICTLLTAAAAIGVTQNVLSKLRASGHFEVKYLARRGGYHELDVKQFIERLLALNPNPMNKTLPDDCITLYQARYPETGEGTASIIRALLSGELRVVGNIDGTVRGLFVSRAEFQQLGRNERARQNGNARTLSEVEKEIHCQRECVPSLVESGLLNGWHTPTGLRISEESIARFKKKYVSLASIAHDIGRSARALKRYCAAGRIPMVVAKYWHGETEQAFIRLKDRSGVLSLRPEQSRNSQRPAERKRRPSATSQDRLKVLHELRQGHITEKQAAVELGFNVSWVRQLLVRWLVGGDSALRPWARRATIQPQNGGSGETASCGTMREEKAGQAAATSADRSALNEDFDAAGQTQAA